VPPPESARERHQRAPERPPNAAKPPKAANGPFKVHTSIKGRQRVPESYRRLPAILLLFFVGEEEKEGTGM